MGGSDRTMTKRLLELTFRWEDVETAVTRIAVAVESIDTVFGDTKLRSPLVELSRGNEFPETLGDEGETRVVTSGYSRRWWLLMFSDIRNN